MKLTKKAELFQPIRDIWENLNYKDISTYEELNLLLNENKIITKFNSKIDNGLFHSITNYENMNICLCFGLDKNQSYDYYLQNLKDNGVILGRPKNSGDSKERTLNKYPEVIKYLEKGLSIREVSRMTKTSVNTTLKVSQLIRQEI